jgi:DNA-binding beta-propeller fold protein YncE
MRIARALALEVSVLILGGCGAAHSVTHGHSTRSAPAPTVTRTSGPAPPRRVPRPQALVTAETENRLLVVNLPSGRVTRSVTLPADPENIAVTGSGSGGVVVVVSPKAGKVTVLDRVTLRPIKTFGGFEDPQIAVISPDRRHLYVTDGARGTLTAIRLSDLAVTSTVSVGAGAHHLAFTPDQRRVWVALGQSASQISILDTTNLDRPHLIGRFSPGFPAHDLSFTPDGRRAWVSSAAGPDVTVFSTPNLRPLFRIPVGTPPQHIALAGRYAYLTSGYGDTIEKVDVATGRVISRTSAPHGSFELDAADGYVATSSLLHGTLAIYSPNLKLLRVVDLAPVTREVAISRP